MGAKRVIRTLVLILFFSLLFYFLIDKLLLKDIDKEMELSQKLALQKQMYEYSLENRKHLENELQQYEYISKFLEKKEPLKDLKKFMEKFFKVEKVVIVDRKEEDKITKKIYQVKILIHSPKDFYHFVEYIERKGYPLMIKPPLKFRKRGNLIEVIFFLEYFSIK